MAAPSDDRTPPSAPATARRPPAEGALALAALGVVFGDIGTSPLYALHVCFMADGGVPPTPANVLGVLSLVFWALIVVISIKYVVFVMRADLNGEGGVLALTALATGAETKTRPRRWLLALGLFGAALLYGDGMLTPAISVLSAVEGLKIATPLFQPAVRPIAIGVLIALFWLQRRGTGAVGAIFGPVMVVWFVALIALGLRWIGGAPEVLAALSPHHGVRFLVEGGRTGFFLLGSVFLAVTGGEALYADIGHFGTRPIRLMWFALVLPAVMINYLGQGAMLLQDAHAVHHTFFSLAPGWLLYPLVALATAAAVIASQAIISGAFSLTSQAVQLGYWPRLDIRHSSETEEGQVYVPLINWVLLAATVALVLHFRTSDGLAGAYGVAVSGTMVLTTMLAMAYFRHRWGLLPVLVIGALLLPVDLTFTAANLIKLDQGGIVPLLVGAAGYVIFRTWIDGQDRLSARLERRDVEFASPAVLAGAVRVPGVAVYLSRTQSVPRILVLNLTRNHVLHERVVILTVKIDPVPRVAERDRVTVTRFVSDFVGVVGRYGYLERPNVPALLRAAHLDGPIDLEATTFFHAGVHVIPRFGRGMARWRQRLFVFMSRNAHSTATSYRIPADRLFEIGIAVEL